MPMNILFPSIQKALIKLEHKDQNTYGETFLNTTYRISFLHNYCGGKSAIQVHISPPPFIVNKNTKQNSE
jgi:hypothetical protein